MLPPPDALPEIAHLEVTRTGTLFAWAATTTQLYKSSDRGASWHEVGLSPAASRNDVGRFHDLLDPSDGRLYLATDHGVFTSSDEAQTWSLIGLKTRDVTALAQTKSGVLLASTDDAIYRFDGQTWHSSGDGIFRSFTDALAVGDDGTIVAGDWVSGRVSMQPPGQETWTTMGYFGYVRDITLTPDGRVFLCTGTGSPSVFSTSDDGATWVAYDLEDIHDLFLTRRGTLMALGSDATYRSDDGGTQWTPLDPGTGPMADMIAVRDTLYAATPNGIYRSTNDGLTWTMAAVSDQPARKVAVHGEKIFIQVDCSSLTCQDYILRTSDGGASWTKVLQAGADGIDEMIVSPHGTLYVSAGYSVLSTRDDGDTWTVLDTGLPTTFPKQSLLTAMVMDDDDYLYVGTWGRSVYRTVRPVSVPTEEDVAPSIGSLRTYPNPFSERTTIVFSLLQPAQVDLRVYDALGRQLVVLAQHVFPAGPHEVVWDSGGAPSGLYLCRLRVGSHLQTSLLMLVH